MDVQQAFSSHEDLRRPQRASARDASPLCTLPLAEQVADHLGHLILRSECPPGSRLKEETFADLYHVSRGPVREAFRILERRGLVEILPRHGARVRSFDLGELGSLFTVRAVLFGLAAGEATRHAKPEFIDRLTALVEQLQQSAETMDISARDHGLLASDAMQLIARFSDNKPLIRILDEIKINPLWRMAWSETPVDFATQARRRQSARYWRDLLNAMKGGDAPSAERIARALLEAARDSMMSGITALRREAAPT
ncbi:GntR family transcriptional regulator [Reyranella sp. CPCC 100927]|uniref:GntR family transcriptional regulator n=1 Tax=Reyranella sp. CPCC 100927 TaxID=2599616 RepID=UPI0011B4D768|nr:GntR family transcriptional regulator [Reyranella sp. CPCC 100927]TWT15428.1 GntR family transcriptional regulator [Reyranella sp. CPCC 100927]